MAIKGGSDVVKDLQAGKFNEGTAMSGLGAAGGAVGAGALLALGASNPIGWIALAVGGAALLGRSLYDQAHNYEKAGGEVEKEFNNYTRQIEKESRETDKFYNNLKNSISEEEDVSEARKLLIDSGILSEKDMQEAQKMSKEELLNLTEQYKNSAKEFSNAEKEITNQLKKEKITEANDAAKSIKEWFDNDFKKNDTMENWNVAWELIQQNKDAIENKQASGAELSDSEKEFIKRYQKNLENGENKNSYNDLKWILEGGGSWWGISDSVMANTKNFDYEYFMKVAEENGKKDSFKNFSGYRTEDIPYLSAMQQAKNEADAKSAIESAKKAGVEYDRYGSIIDPVLSQWGIEKYAVGSNLIPFDQIALLHAGESVLTADATSNLKDFLGTEDIKNFDGGTFNQTLSNGLSSFSSVIVDQTKTLVNKMDEIIVAISNKRSGIFTSRMTDEQRQEFAL